MNGNGGGRALRRGVRRGRRNRLGAGRGRRARPGAHQSAGLLRIQRDRARNVFRRLARAVGRRAAPALTPVLPAHCAAPDVPAAIPDARFGITLGLATLGVVRVPTGPVEALIALSIVLLAVEITRRDRGTGGLTARKPWLAAFTFGLLHGFGFAGALSQIGLPTGDVPLALLAFNLGVEAGRIAFIAAATALLRATQALRIRPRPWMRAVPACTIGAFASFWLLQCCTALLG